MEAPVSLYIATLYRVSRLFTWKGLGRFLDGEFTRIPAGARVLSVGAGGRFNEILLRHARRQAFEVTSLDIDLQRRPDIVGDLCSPPLLAERFDAVVVGEVLEHVHSPRLATAGIHRLLKPGGRIILTTPFIFPIHDRPRDYYRFTRYGLEVLLSDFRDVSIVARNSWAEAINALGVRLVLEPGIPARVLSPFVLLAAVAALPAAWLLGRLVPSDFMTIGYLVTARK